MKCNLAEFQIGQLFEKVDVKNVKGKASDYSETPTDKYSIPLLSSTGENQGFHRYAKKEDCSALLYNVISIASNGTAGATFYQKGPFAILQDAYVIRLLNHPMDEPIGLFLATAIRKAIFGKYNWSNKAKWADVEQEYIVLPVDDAGEPNWEYMEAYIQNMELQNYKKLHEILTKKI